MVLIGGISKNSLNRRFFEAVARLAAESHKSLSFNVFDISQLPFYSQEAESDPPTAANELAMAAASAAAVLIVTPEYNRSIPGVLKNALDWGSRLDKIENPGDGKYNHDGGNGNSDGGKDGKSGKPPVKGIWAGKPTAIIGASPGGIGTFGAQQHLRSILSQLDMPTMNQPAVYFNASTGLVSVGATAGATTAGGTAGNGSTAAAGAATAGSDRLSDGSAGFIDSFLSAFEAWIAKFQPQS